MRLFSRPSTATRSAIGVPPVGKATPFDATVSIVSASPAGAGGRIWLAPDDGRTAGRLSAR
ncbi:MAG: hypothetical protein OSB00_16590 [Sphingomonas bacterium]|nr:hypothetical protein [Sphingomonas bacterium]